MIGQIFRKLLESLSVSDIVAILNGQHEPLQKIHPNLQAYLKELLKGDETPNGFQRLAEGIAESFGDSIRGNQLPSVTLHSFICVDLKYLFF